ncbi:MAG: GNAT family N-acetyltransferase [Candidatus Pacebacteria bacterium]|nr:GNAT family N-acetyltransferase [Candidatus Paceibacterota bacterium]
MLRLVLPTIKYIKDIERAHYEQYMHKEITKEVWDEIKSGLKNPHSFIKAIRDKSKGKGLAPGQLPLTRYWLIDNNEYIGTLRLSGKISQKMRYREGHLGYQIRPSKRKQGYGTKILNLGLLKARNVGLKKVYINCSKDNIASQKIIERNGGRLLRLMEQENGTQSSLHYVIELNSTTRH